MTPPKPKHSTTVGHLRLTLLGNGRHGQPASFTLERRHDLASESWYPTANFPVSELGPLEEAIRAAKAFLEPKPPKPANGSGKGAASRNGGNPAETEDEAEEPPFDPTGPSSRVPVQGPVPSPVQTPSASPTPDSVRSKSLPSATPTPGKPTADPARTKPIHTPAKAPAQPRRASKRPTAKATKAAKPSTPKQRSRAR